MTFHSRVWRGLAGLGWLLLGIIMAGCAGTSPPVAPTTPLTSTLVPAATEEKPGLTPSALPSLTPTASLTLTPEPTQTFIPSPTLQPTGIFPIGDKVIQPGQNEYTAVVQYETPMHYTYTQSVHFLLFLPASYGKDPAKKWPVIMYLHGSGSRGTNIALVRNYLLPKMVDNQPNFPFIVISPQCPPEASMWSSQIDALNALLDLVQARYAVDPHRLYLTGFSMGGFGTWEFSLTYPRRFAAIAPVAGGYIFQSPVVPDAICDLKTLPVWVFHGGQDTTVLPDQSVNLVNALKACRGNVHFTYYADANHNTTAVRAYSDPQLYEWLAAQTSP